MSDISINQRANIFDNERPVKISPKYLVLIDDIEEKTTGSKSKKETTTSPVISKFVATKYEEGTTTAKLTGFFSSKSQQEITEKYLEIVQAADKSIYVELQVPWMRIIKIQNLIYKSK